LLRGGAVGGAFAFQSVANGAFEQAGIESALDQIIGGAGLHGVEVDLVLALAGEENDGRLASVIEGGAEELDAVVRAQAIVDQANLVLATQHGLEPGGEVLHPLQFDSLADELFEQLASQDKVVLVIFDEQHAEHFAWSRLFHCDYFLAGSSTISNQ
jgi:hypothetical protein